MLRKRSRHIHLLLIGAAGVLVAGCDNSVRYTYANKEDCQKDWSEADCHYETSSSGSHISRYYTIKKNSFRPRSISSRAISVKRSGFGSSFRSSGG